MTAVHYDTAENFHPFECDGKGMCCHCDRAIVYSFDSKGRRSLTHHPATCSLCDPDYDGMENPYRAEVPA